MQISSAAPEPATKTGYKPISGFFYLHGYWFLYFFFG
jgi:hypothetical protein